VAVLDQRLTRCGRRLTELEQQTDELQQRLRASSQPSSALLLPGSSWVNANDLQGSHTDTESRLASVAPFFRQEAIAPASFRSFSQAAVETMQTPESLPHDGQAHALSTLSRSIDGYAVDSKDIDALFRL
jgi:hypothetical protein